MNGVKEALKVKMAEGGIRITEEDPLNALIDVMTLWIKENNAALSADLEKREEALRRLRELTLGQKAAVQ